MKNHLFCTVLIVFAFSSCTPDAKEILKQSFEKCQSVQNGYYEMTRFVKYSTDKDTTVSSFKCYFRKLLGDSLSDAAFHYKEYYRNEGIDDKIHIRENLYTGEDFVTFSEDSSAEVISKTKWPMRVQTCLYSTTLFMPFTDRFSSPLLNDTDLLKSRATLILLEDEEINGTNCYHLKVNQPSVIDSNVFIKLLSGEFNFWIRKKDYLPMQYTSYIQNLIDRDTVYQYEKYILNNYEINNLNDESILKLKSIPPDYKVTYFKGIGGIQSNP